jgi:hypothetical protein
MTARVTNKLLLTSEPLYTASLVTRQRMSVDTILDTLDSVGCGDLN